MRASDPLWRAMFAADHKLRSAAQINVNEEAATTNAVSCRAAPPTRTGPAAAKVTRRGSGDRVRAREQSHPHERHETARCETLGRDATEIINDVAPPTSALSHVSPIHFGHLQLGPRPLLLTEVESPSEEQTRHRRHLRHPRPLSSAPERSPSSPSLAACRAAVQVFRARYREFSAWEAQARQTTQSLEALARMQLTVCALRQLQAVLTRLPATSQATLSHAVNSNEEEIITPNLSLFVSSKAYTEGCRHDACTGVLATAAAANTTTPASSAQRGVAVDKDEGGVCAWGAENSREHTQRPVVCHTPPPPLWSDCAESAHESPGLAARAERVVEGAIAAALRVRQACAAATSHEGGEGAQCHHPHCVCHRDEGRGGKETTPPAAMAHIPWTASAAVEESRACGGVSAVHAADGEGASQLPLSSACLEHFPALSLVLAAAMSEAPGGGGVGGLCAGNSVDSSPPKTDSKTKTKECEMQTCADAPTRCERGACQYCSAVTEWAKTRPVLAAMAAAMMEEATRCKKDDKKRRQLNGHSALKK